jgi:ATP-dependent helicase/nuclease subunit B
MTSFIRQVAHTILTSGKETSHITVVMPSQRATKYIQQALFEQLGKPFFSPNFVTMNKWIDQIVPQRIISSNEALFELYHVHGELAEQKESFDEFMHWGRLLLSDFDEIDRYLVDAKKLFRNLRDVKEIENWSFDSEKELTTNQLKFLEFWEKLGPYYAAFHARLAQKELCISGSAYRKVADHIEFAAGKMDEFFFFVGFNALSPAEIAIMKQLSRMGKARILLEGDDFFVKDVIHEAGRFIRHVRKELPEVELFARNLLLTESKSFHVISCAQATSQVKAGYSILRSLSTDELNGTLLLLADESLAVPAIKHIPEEVGKANITLGLPLKSTLLRTWVDILFEIQDNHQYFNSSAAYHKTLLRFLQHPFFRKFAGEDHDAFVESTMVDVVRFNRLFSNPEQSAYSERVNEFIRMAFTSWGDDRLRAISQIRQLNSVLFPCFEREQDLLERSALAAFDDAISELQQMVERHIPPMSLSVFRGIFNQHWLNKSVAYYGNPTDGLQIMGLLETRMLDFERIIVIGLNEGKMPPNNMIQTIIPMDLRRYFGMPTPADKDALFAHHFYRLLSGVKECWITYNSAKDELQGANEHSRYIRQLEIELVNQNKQVSWQNYTFELPQNEEQPHMPAVMNSDAVRERILAFMERGVSASAFNKFLTCPLDFYYRYVLGLYESDEVEEEVESSTFGSMVHNVLEHLYKPFVEQKIQLTEFDIDRMLENYTPLLYNEFSNQFDGKPELFEKGRNFLSYKMAALQIDRFLRAEREMLQQNPDKQLYILALEQEVLTTIPFEWDGTMHTITLKGFIDRVDSWGGDLRVIDYKTGKCESDHVTWKITEVDLQNDFQLLRKTLNKAKHVLQLGMYNWLYFAQEGKFPNEACILSLRNLSSGYQALMATKNERVVVNDAYLGLVRGLLERLLHEMLSIPEFEHEPKSMYCQYCMK